MRGGVKDKVENKLGRESVFEGRDVKCDGMLNSSANGLRGVNGGNAKEATGDDFFLTLVRPSFSFSVDSRLSALVSFKTAGQSKFSLFSPASTACLVVIFSTLVCLCRVI